MNKRGLIKYIFILLVSYLYFKFMITSKIFTSIFDLSIIFAFLFALTIFMFSNKNKIKKFKFIYDVTLLLLLIFSVGFILYYLYSMITCYINTTCTNNFEPIFTILYPMLLFMMILFGYKDISNKTNKTNDILTIIILSLNILIYLRCYLDAGFIQKIIGKEEYIVYGYNYISQNFIYFTIMYFVVFVHYKLNKIR